MPRALLIICILSSLFAYSQDAATGALREPPAKAAKRRRGFKRALMLATVGGLLATAFNEGIRTKVLDLLFGAEEKFDYTSTTAPSNAAERRLRAINPGVQPHLSPGDRLT